MPTVNIELLEGRTEEQQRHLMEAVTSAVCEALSVDAETVDIRIWELKRAATARGGRFFSDVGRPVDPTQRRAG